AAARPRRAQGGCRGGSRPAARGTGRPGAGGGRRRGRVPRRRGGRRPAQDPLGQDPAPHDARDRRRRRPHGPLDDRGPRGAGHPARCAAPRVSEDGAVRDIVVLGSTGSIGTQALDLVRRHPDRFRVVGLTAGGSNPDLFEAQVAEFAPAYSGLGEGASVEAAGMACDVVLNGITGAVGLLPTPAALDAGTTPPPANKESLIIGGELVTSRARPGQIVPVDSEHSALAQCLLSGTSEEVRRLVLTASGGPFRGRTRAELADVTPEAALNHPTWSMGPVI